MGIIQELAVGLMMFDGCHTHPSYVQILSKEQVNIENQPQ